MTVAATTKEEESLYTVLSGSSGYMGRHLTMELLAYFKIPPLMHHAPFSKSVTFINAARAFLSKALDTVAGPGAMAMWDSALHEASEELRVVFGRKGNFVMKYKGKTLYCTQSQLVTSLQGGGVVTAGSMHRVTGTADKLSYTGKDIEWEGSLWGGFRLMQYYNFGSCALDGASSALDDASTAPKSLDEGKSSVHKGKGRPSKRPKHDGIWASKNGKRGRPTKGQTVIYDTSYYKTCIQQMVDRHLAKRGLRRVTKEEACAFVLQLL